MNKNKNIKLRAVYITEQGETDMVDVFSLFDNEFVRYVGTFCNDYEGEFFFFLTSPGVFTIKEGAYILEASLKDKDWKESRSLDGIIGKEDIEELINDYKGQK